MTFIIMPLITALPVSFYLSLAPAEEKKGTSDVSCCTVPAEKERSVARHSDSVPTDVSPQAAKRLFDRFTMLGGTWVGTSTKGWKEETAIRTIAQGSVVQFTSFGAHPNETMLTLVHLDLDRLLITHYCVAKNQPRLRLTSVGDGGTTAVFTFLDGTNLTSRDQGHMDKVVYRFYDEDHFSSQWTWYQNGQERWMEEIMNERKK